MFITHYPLLTPLNLFTFPACPLPVLFFFFLFSCSLGITNVALMDDPIPLYHCGIVIFLQYLYSSYLNSDKCQVAL